MTSDKTLLARILTKSYPITPPELQGLADRIEEIEGFHVHLDFVNKPPGNTDISPGRYDYERAASGKMNVGKWTEKRFKTRFPFLKVGIVTTQGRPVFDEELLSYARGQMLLSIGTYLRVKIESRKDSQSEKAIELAGLDQVCSAFSIFTKRELVDEPGKLLFWKWHTNELNLETKLFYLRYHESVAIEEILTVVLERMGVQTAIYREHVNPDELVPEDCFSSRDLNDFIPSQQQDFVSNLIDLDS